MAEKAKVQVRRVYDPPARGDGTRVLVDRLWPRGLTKTKADLDEWCKEVAPSTELRKWYSHDPSRFEEFTRVTMTNSNNLSDPTPWPIYGNWRRTGPLPCSPRPSGPRSARPRSSPGCSAADVRRVSVTTLGQLHRSIRAVSGLAVRSSSGGGPVGRSGCPLGGSRVDTPLGRHRLRTTRRGPP